ncbi:MAG: PEP-CTERM sorting domain-containing protein [Phycisphaerae bacterium]
MSCRLLPRAAVVVLVLTAGLRAGPIVIHVDPVWGSTDNTGATAEITLTFSEIGAEDLLAVTVTNTTSAAIGSTLTAVGFEMPPWLNLAPAFAPGGTSSYFDRLTFNAAVSPGYLDAPGGYDVMITSDGSFEGGNPRGGPTAGQSQTVTLTLGDTGLTASGLASAFIDYYESLATHYAIARFQAVGPRGNLSDKVGGHAPEPATVLGFAIGAIVCFGMKRSRAGTAGR